MKQLIVITHEEPIPHETAIIMRLIDMGVDRIHLRKPHATRHDLERLLQDIYHEYHPRITLHDAHDLSRKYNVGGVHLNRRHPGKPHGWNGGVSRSCHSIPEITQYKSSHDYLFLSPIYDSISKQGYTTGFTPCQLLQAHSQGIIDNKVIALGGITSENIDEVLSYGFGGVALLGDVWNNTDIHLIEHKIELIKNRLICSNLSHTAPLDIVT